MTAVAGLDSSSQIDVPGRGQVSLRPKYRAPFGTCLVRATMQALPRRSAAAPLSCGVDHRPRVLRLPALKWRSPRLRPRVAAFPRPHDTSVSAKDFARLAQTSRWARARTAGLACGWRPPPPDPTGRKTPKGARHRNSSGAPGSSPLTPDSSLRFYYVNTL